LLIPLEQVSFTDYR